MSIEVTKTKKEEKMPKRNALSLFPNGKEGVLERMNKKVSKVLCKKNPKFCRCFAEEFDLDTKEIKKLKQGTFNVDFKFFEKIKGALGLSLHDILGKPKFRNENEKVFWSKQCQVMPMALTAPSKEPGHSTPQQQGDDIELNFYLRRRAVHELVWNL